MLGHTTAALNSCESPASTSTVPVTAIITPIRLFLPGAIFSSALRPITSSAAAPTSAVPQRAAEGPTVGKLVSGSVNSARSTMRSAKNTRHSATAGHGEYLFILIFS